MNLLALIFLLVATLALLLVPRRWAPVPLLAGACYMTLGQGLEIGGYNLYLFRLILATGWVRIIIRRERPQGLMLGMDWVFIAWAGWALLASFFHDDPDATLKNHLGMAYNVLSIYFLVRSFCQNEKESRKVLKVTAWLLVPLALTMLYEHVSHYNLFSVFGGVPAESLIRGGRVRAQGPFAHPILAGTVGAVCIPMMIGIWQYHKFSARLGLVASLAMVVASASSGPVISVISGLFALLVWHWRHWTRQMRIAAVLGYLLLELVMKAPSYYLIARIPLIGGNAWHRAAIIDAAVTHFKEWWFAGTDFTLHWMPYGVSWSPDHSDITNHYIGQGVRGGLPLMLLFICLLWMGFRYVGQILQIWSDEQGKQRFLMWSLGASLFAHAASCVSVAYFDQSILFLYLTLALITSMRVKATREDLAPEAFEKENTPLPTEPTMALPRI